MFGLLVSLNQGSVSPMGAILSRIIISKINSTYVKVSVDLP